MNIKLNSLKIENFKGIKNFQVEFGAGTVIKAENGVGKTTVYDAFLWLLFNKDSTGRTDFDLRPLDKNNKPIKGLVLAVTAELDLDGAVHIFKKENHEKIVKGQIRGYETLCYIDEVPKKVGEYADYIEEIIPETNFKMLTNLRHFNEWLKWTERRKVLLDIAGTIEEPDGFDELYAALNGRTIDDYKKVLAGQRDRLKKDRDEINPRIDELNKALPEQSEADTKELTAKRDETKAVILNLSKKINDLFTHEAARQKQIESLNNLKLKLANRAMQLSNDTSNVKTLLKEKSDIDIALADVRQKVSLAEQEISLWTSKIQSKQFKLDEVLSRRTALITQWQTLKDAKIDATCYACKQTLPTDKVASLEKARQLELEVITKKGCDCKREIDEVQSAIEGLQKELTAYQDELAKAQTDLRDAETAKAKRFTEIESLMKSNKTIPPEQDQVWQSISAEIARASDGIEVSVSDQMQIIQDEKIKKSDELEMLNNVLAQADNTAKSKLRIKELEAKEKELAQQIAGVEKQLADIGEYTKQVSALIEDAVNGKFKHVTFKLFEQLQNGNIEDTCVAILNGVPYADMSYGQRIFVGIDIINVLSKHYGLSVPLFIDNAEGLTLPVEAQSQVIQLFAQKGITKLTVEKIK
jgi:DNA repair protein SbcC/Rad50